MVSAIFFSLYILLPIWIQIGLVRSFAPGVHFNVAFWFVIIYWSTWTIKTVISKANC